MFQSPMLRSQSSIRLPKYAGVHFTAVLASISLGRSDSTAMNQSSAMRKMSGVWQRQQNGKRWTISPAERSRPRSARSTTICSAASPVPWPCSQP
jgi:hypothetical protein